MTDDIELKGKLGWRLYQEVIHQGSAESVQGLGPVEGDESNVAVGAPLLHFDELQVGQLGRHQPDVADNASADDDILDDDVDDARKMDRHFDKLLVVVAAYFVGQIFEEAHWQEQLAQVFKISPNDEYISP